MSTELFRLAQQLENIQMQEQLENIQAQLDDIQNEQQLQQITNQLSQAGETQASNNTNKIQKALGISRNNAQTLEKVFTPKTTK